MKVTVKALSRSWPRGAGPLVLEVPAGTTVSELLNQLRAEDEAAAATIDRAVLVLNRGRAEPEAVLQDGDELAIYPILAGGA